MWYNSSQHFARMTQFLPPNLLALFSPREPIPYLPPASKLPHEKKNGGYTGVGIFLKYFEVIKVHYVFLSRTSYYFILRFRVIFGIHFYTHIYTFKNILLIALRYIPFVLCVMFIRVKYFFILHINKCFSFT